MPALGEALGPRGTSEVAVYVQGLSGTHVDPALAAAGAKHYATLCVACHGPEGRGNALVGAPNLTDDVWLHGGSFDAIAESVRAGRSGEMPAHLPLIGEARARLAAAWVLSRGRRDGEGGATGSAGAAQP